MKTVQNKSTGPFGKRGWWNIHSILRVLRPALMVAGLLTAISGFKLSGQGVGISEVTITPDASSILELRSVQRGLLVPRMTTLQRLAIASPAQGLMVYDTDTQSFWYYDNFWRTVPASLAGTSNQILGMNAAGTANEFKTLSGTLNQISVAHAPGFIILSLPQDIHYGATPRFVTLLLSGLSANAGVYTDANRLLTTTPPSSGIIGYWTRTGTVLSPSNAGDDITTS
ncbi:MAG: hypothetical protein ACUVTX_09610, partial [Bacteroidales bacterium]